MTGFADPRSIVILDRRPEYARLLAALALADQPALPVAVFGDLDEAERWLAGAPTPVMVLADVTAAAGTAIGRARAWQRDRAGITLVAMFDANVEGQVRLAEAADADIALPKPCCRSDWDRSCGALLRTGRPAGVTA